MIQASDLLEPSLERGYSFYTGVPCSFLTALINHTLSRRDLTYVGAASEGEAVGIAAGAYLAGRRSVTMCQNSGLGNMVNPLSSLAHPFRLPLLLLVTHRGQPGLHDEPQHAVMGRTTGKLLDLMEVAWRPFPSTAADVEAALDDADKTMASAGLPFAFVVPKGAVAPSDLEPAPRSLPVDGELERRDLVGKRMSRLQALETTLSALSGDEAVVSTTGKTSRELFVLADRPNNFYVVGSMGCAAGIGLGVALCRSARRVVVFDGDGALLMKMGTMATIGHHAPENLIHVILDNEVHDSTGGQATASPTTAFAVIAAGCRYRRAIYVESPEELAEVTQDAVGSPGPIAIHVKIAPGSLRGVGRPTLAPVEVKERFMEFLDHGG